MDQNRPFSLSDAASGAFRIFSAGSSKFLKYVKTMTGGVG